MVAYQIIMLRLLGRRLQATPKRWGDQIRRETANGARTCCRGPYQLINFEATSSRTVGAYSLSSHNLIATGQGLIRQAHTSPAAAIDLSVSPSLSWTTKPTPGRRGATKAPPTTRNTAELHLLDWKDAPFQVLHDFADIPSNKLLDLVRDANKIRHASKESMLLPPENGDLLQNVHIVIVTDALGAKFDVSSLYSTLRSVGATVEYIPFCIPSHASQDDDSRNVLNEILEKLASRPDKVTHGESYNGSKAAREKKTLPRLCYARSPKHLGPDGTLPDELSGLVSTTSGPRPDIVLTIAPTLCEYHFSALASKEERDKLDTVDDYTLTPGVSSLFEDPKYLKEEAEYLASEDFQRATEQARLNLMRTLENNQVQVPPGLAQNDSAEEEHNADINVELNADTDLTELQASLDKQLKRIQDERKAVDEAEFQRRQRTLRKKGRGSSSYDDDLDVELDEFTALEEISPERAQELLVMEEDSDYDEDKSDRYDTIAKRTNRLSFGVINLLSQHSKPINTLAMLKSVIDHRGSLVATKFAFLGTRNAPIALDLARASTILGFDYSMAGPFVQFDKATYRSLTAKTSKRQILDKLSGASSRVTQWLGDPELAVQNADVVVTDTVVPFLNDQARKSHPLSQEHEEFLVSEELLALAKPQVKLLHDFPIAYSFDDAGTNTSGPEYKAHIVPAEGGAYVDLASNTFSNSSKGAESRVVSALPPNGLDDERCLLTKQWQNQQTMLLAVIQAMLGLK